MKVSELIKHLQNYEDFDVRISFRDDVLDNATGATNMASYWPTYRWFNLTGIGDIGHSDKVVQLEVEER